MSPPRRSAGRCRRFVGGALDELLNRIGSGHVERKCHGSPPSATIASTSCWHLSTPWRPAQTGKPRVASSVAVAAPIPDDAPATIAGPRGVGFESGHQARFTVMGRAAKPRTLLECTVKNEFRRSRNSTRFTSSVSATLASIRQVHRGRNAPRFRNLKEFRNR